MGKKEVGPGGSKGWRLRVRHRTICVSCAWAKGQGQTRAAKLREVCSVLVWKAGHKWGIRAQHLPESRLKGSVSFHLSCRAPTQPPEVEAYETSLKEEEFHPLKFEHYVNIMNIITTERSEFFTQGVELNPSPNSWVLSWTFGQQFFSLGLQLKNFSYFSKRISHLSATWTCGCHSAEDSSPGWPTHQHPGHALAWKCLRQPSGAPSQHKPDSSVCWSVHISLWSSSPPVPSEHCDLPLTPKFPHGDCTLIYWQTLLSPSWYELAFPWFGHNPLIRCWEMMFWCLKTLMRQVEHLQTSAWRRGKWGVNPGWNSGCWRNWHIHYPITNKREKNSFPSVDLSFFKIHFSS